jgi:REP element-mobilizing transposase RayT
MPRRPRLFVPGAIYHVYCRVARGEFVFDDGREADEFVEAVREVRDLDGWEVLAWDGEPKQARIPVEASVRHSSCHMVYIGLT